MCMSQHLLTLELQLQRWSDVSCSTLRPYVCKRAPQNLPTATNPSTNNGVTNTPPPRNYPRQLRFTRRPQSRSISTHFNRLPAVSAEETSLSSESVFNNTQPIEIALPKRRIEPTPPPIRRPVIPSFSGFNHDQFGSNRLRQFDIDEQRLAQQRQGRREFVQPILLGPPLLWQNFGG
jgi:hypothetical protein